MSEIDNHAAVTSVRNRPTTEQTNMNTPTPTFPPKTPADIYDLQKYRYDEVVDAQMAVQFTLPAALIKNAESRGWILEDFRILAQYEWQLMKVAAATAGHTYYCYCCDDKLLAMARKIGIAVRHSPSGELKILAKVWT